MLDQVRPGDGKQMTREMWRLSECKIWWRGLACAACIRVSLFSLPFSLSWRCCSALSFFLDEVAIAGGRDSSWAPSLARTDPTAESKRCSQPRGAGRYGDSQPTAVGWLAVGCRPLPMDICRRPMAMAMANTLPRIIFFLQRMLKQLYCSKTVR